MATENTFFVSRHAFEDAQYEHLAAAKLQMLDGAAEHAHKFDLPFGILIVLNLILLGVEIEVDDPRVGPGNTFWWTEVRSTIRETFVMGSVVP